MMTRVKVKVPWHLPQPEPAPFPEMSACTAQLGSPDVDAPARPSGASAPDANVFARLAAIVYASADAILSLDLEGRITSWNGGAERLMGFTAAEMIGQPVTRLIPAESVDEERLFLEAVRKGEAMPPYDALRCTKDGRRLWVSVSIAALRDAAGVVTGTCEIGRDVTGRVQAETALRENDERLRCLADAAPVIIWLAGPDKLFNYFNRAWLEFTGHADDEEVDIDWSENLHPEDLERCLATYKTSFDACHPFEMEYRLRHHSGEYRWLLDRGVPRVAPDGAFEGYIGAAIDIHDHKIAAESLRRSNESASRAKDEFLAALSHELRTPLSPVLMLASALEHTMELPEHVRTDCGMIRKNVELEARLIDDLLDLTRITRGKMTLRFEGLDPHPLIEHTLEILRSDLHAKQIRVETFFCTPTPFVSADSVRLQQVFWNILKNAVKFTPAGGGITIRSRSDGRQWGVEIIDTGLGITAEEMPQIFNAFSQGKEAAEPSFGGVGLGLAISAHIVQEHRGRLWAESLGRGHGSTFHLEVPLAPMTNSGRIKLPPPAPKRQPMRILLVEDHEASRSTLHRLLSRRGHTVATAASLAQARHLAGSFIFDIVVSDLGLPDGSGHDLMRELRERHQLCGIALSGYGMAGDLKHSLESGFNDHLTKPVDVNTLEQAMLRVVAAHPVLS